MVVLGRKGRRIEEIKTIGSVSRNIAENAVVPVILVNKSQENYIKRF